MHVHILGICGTLMGSIAMLAKAQGHVITGSDDQLYPPMSTQLDKAGIDISEGYSANSVPNSVDMVIVGNANLKRGNPALEAVLDSRTPYISGAEWVGRYLLKDRWVIAVAGTHGKTTTTSMIAWILESAGLSPGFLIGGVPQNFGQSSRLGHEPFFVIEADEYDTSYFDRRSKFLHYHPQTLVMNNLEFDHADIFDDLEAIKQQFHLLLRSVPGNGLVIHHHDDIHLRDVIDRGCWTPQLTIGSNQLSAEALADDCSTFTISLDGKATGKIHWGLSGLHNVNNALSAIAAARHAGVSAEVSCDALSGFGGVKRRMEVLHKEPGLTIYDDFAHHPTAIRATLQGLRARVKDETIMAVIEPASHTMKKGVHAETLAESTEGADEVIWFQPHHISWDMSRLENTKSRLISDHSSMIRVVVERARNQSDSLHIVIMSNGSFDGAHQEIIQGLRT